MYPEMVALATMTTPTPQLVIDNTFIYSPCRALDRGASNRLRSDNYEQVATRTILMRAFSDQEVLQLNTADTRAVFHHEVCPFLF